MKVIVMSKNWMDGVSMVIQLIHDLYKISPFIYVECK